MKRITTLVLLLALLGACATSPTGRKQLIILPEQQMAVMGAQSFQQMRRDIPEVKDPATVAYVRCVAEAITRLPEIARQGPWEVVVFDSDAVNAFALPGGKIGVYQGLLRVAETPDQLAAVIGHEVGHVIAHHGNERVSQNFAVQQTLAILDNWMAANNTDNRQLLMSALGLGSQVGILLPFSRLHESEADTIGLELMARAGFDPRQAVELWKNMARASGGKNPPELLSTHPAHETRIRDLQAGMEKALALYRQARGRAPRCR